MAQQSYSEQITWCDDALNNIEYLKYSLKSTVGDVQAVLQYLTTVAVMKEDVDNLQGFDSRFEDEAKEVYMLIQTDNVDYIEAQKKRLLLMSNG